MVNPPHTHTHTRARAQTMRCDMQVLAKYRLC